MRILFVKFGAIGDIVQAAAALKQVRLSDPLTRIELLTSVGLVDLVSSFNVANKVYGIDDSKFLLGRTFKKSVFLLRHIITLPFILGRYDLIVTAYVDWRYRLITCLVPCSKRTSFSSESYLRGLIQHRSRIFEYHRLITAKDSEPINIAELVNSIGASALNSSVLEDSNLGPLPDDFVVLIPGGAKNLLRNDDLRRWPIENYVGLAKEFLSAGYSVVLVGGLTDEWASSYFSDLNIINLIGKTRLIDLLSIYEKSKIVIGHDCGPMHIATLSHAPVLTLFGPTPSNTFFIRNRKYSVYIESGNSVSCSPCYDGQNYAACNEAKCMKSISIKEVYDSASNLLATPKID